MIFTRINSLQKFSFWDKFPAQKILEVSFISLKFCLAWSPQFEHKIALTGGLKKMTNRKKKR